VKQRWRPLLALSVVMILAVSMVARGAGGPVSVKVACVQFSSDLGDVGGNGKKLAALVEEAAGHGAKIIVLPEAAISGYLSQDLRTNWHGSGPTGASTGRNRGAATAFRRSSPPAAKSSPRPSICMGRRSFTRRSRRRGRSNVRSRGRDAGRGTPKPRFIFKFRE